VISNDLNNQSNPEFSGLDNLGPPQSQSLSDFAYVWGQFIDHDMDLTPTQSGPGAETANIDPSGQSGDPMTGGEPFTRSVFITDANGVRQQINVNTSYLDLPQVYGSTQVVADALRVVNPDGTLGYLLKTSPGGLLPYDNTTYFTPDQIQALGMANDAMQVVTSQLFAAGDVRANENIELTAVQTLFVRNHNRLATEIHALHPDWTDEHIYQEACKLNIATEEMITYNEFLPAILGPDALPAYTGYSDDVNASIATEFSTVGFRFGHSLLSDTVGRVNNNGTPIADVSQDGSLIPLTADFFDPNLITANGAVDPLTGHTSSNIGPILKADASNTANELDLMLIDSVRNALFAIPNGPGTDLAARDIQRARDHGIGTYNDVRVAYGLAPVTSYAQISSDPAVQAELAATYGPDTPANVNTIDPFEGMLAEDHLAGADVGPTIKAILVKQFTNLRDGDRFFYLNESFTTEELNLLHQADTLSEVIKANTSITNLQSNVFFFKVSIEGTVFFDPNSTGHNTGNGIEGVVIDLLDDTGKMVAQTTTDANGHYQFTDMGDIPGTGNFSVVVEVPTGGHATTVTSHAIHLTRGGLDFDGEDFGIAF
jgi:hypothetical protein